MSMIAYVFKGKCDQAESVQGQAERASGPAGHIPEKSLSESHFDALK
jgi:hypothetical protein